MVQTGGTSEKYQKCNALGLQSLFVPNFKSEKCVYHAGKKPSIIRKKIAKISMNHLIFFMRLKRGQAAIFLLLFAYLYDIFVARNVKKMTFEIFLDRINVGKF